MTNKYMVVIMEEGTNNADYEPFFDGSSQENLKQAKERYEEMIASDKVASASLCLIIDSTDY